MLHFMIVLILYINSLNLSLIKKNVYEEYGAFKSVQQTVKTQIMMYTVSRSSSSSVK